MDKIPSKNNKIILGDMNAKVLEAENEMEKTVMGKYTLKGTDEVADMREDVKDNRDRLIEFCISNELKLDNTMFQKPLERLATYRPIGVSSAERISANRHEQRDFIITAKNNLKVMNCETDTKIELDTDHYPIVAEIATKFRALKYTAQKIHKYEEKSLWKNKEKLNELIQELKDQKQLSSYAHWVEANEKNVDNMEEKKQKLGKNSYQKEQN